MPRRTLTADRRPGRRRPAPGQVPGRPTAGAVARAPAGPARGRRGRRRDGDVITEGSSRVKPGQRFAVGLPEPEPATPAARSDRPLDVLYEDEHLLVLDKPAGLVVHPAPGHARGTLVNALLAHCAGQPLGHRRGVAAGHRPSPRQGRERPHGGRQARPGPRRASRRSSASIGSSGSTRRSSGACRRARPARSTGRSGAIRTTASAWRWSSGGKRALTHYRCEEAAGSLARAPRLDAGDRSHPPDPGSSRHRSVSASSAIRLYRPRRRTEPGPTLERASAELRPARAACARARLRASDHRRRAAGSSAPRRPNSTGFSER